VGCLAAEVEMAEAITYEVPGIHCAHCEAAIKQEVGGVEGVERGPLQ
jgi:hypothetical protein